MHKRFDNKIAAITGATSGIGLETVERFIAEGACVLAIDRDADAGRELAQRFQGAVHFVAADVTQVNALKAAIETAESHFGGLDILFNNAGSGGTRQTVDEFDEQGWDDSQALLIRAVAAGTAYALPAMKRRGGGAIVNTASIAGQQAGFGPLAYSVAKAAVIHYTKVAASQLSMHGVRINAVSPGFVATRIFGTTLGLDRTQAQQLADLAIARNNAPTPLGTAGQPKDIADMVLFLASDAASLITGANFTVDGGITIGPRHSWDSSIPAPMTEAFGLSQAQIQAMGQTK